MSLYSRSAQRARRQMTRIIAGVAAVIALAATACAPATQGGSSAASAASGELLYVCNQNDATVSIIDLGTNQVIETVDLQQLGFSANAKPHHVAVEPDGSHWYVTLIGDSLNILGANAIDAGTNADCPGPNDAPNATFCSPGPDGATQCIEFQPPMTSAFAEARLDSTDSSYIPVRM